MYRSILVTDSSFGIADEAVAPNKGIDAFVTAVVIGHKN